MSFEQSLAGGGDAHYLTLNSSCICYFICSFRHSLIGSWALEKKLSGHKTPRFFNANHRQIDNCRIVGFLSLICFKIEARTQEVFP